MSNFYYIFPEVGFNFGLIAYVAVALGGFGSIPGSFVAGIIIGLVVAIGPTVMMKFSSLTTKPFGVKTIVSLNPIMVDGTGMCGVCRVSIDGVTKFTCVEVLIFDAHKVDWGRA
jgi:branched-subunit amino acid ABC-type transport system permease component